jgi:hypothetical protein
MPKISAVRQGRYKHNQALSSGEKLFVAIVRLAMKDKDVEFFKGEILEVVAELFGVGWMDCEGIRNCFCRKI